MSLFLEMRSFRSDFFIVQFTYCIYWLYLKLSSLNASVQLYNSQSVNCFRAKLQYPHNNSHTMNWFILNSTKLFNQFLRNVVRLFLVVSYPSLAMHSTYFMWCQPIIIVCCFFIPFCFFFAFHSRFNLGD